ncbi:MAG TPA: methyl-accepting chemotaxis protein [Terriglobales bacterium]|nr:methyl-accepting chemotaxis protein [Terriglobales bacterium]
MLTRASLTAKLTLGFVVLIVALAANSLVGYLSVQRLASTTARLDAAVEKRRLVLQMRLALEEQRAGVRGYLLGNPNLQEVEEGRQNLQSAVDKYSSLKSESTASEWSSLQQASAQYQQIMDRETALRREGKTKEATAVLFGPQATQARSAINAAFDALMQQEQAAKESALQEQHSADSKTRVLLGLFAFVGIAVGIAVALLVPRLLARSVSAMMSVIHDIADNNLSTADVSITSEDELGQAGAALNAMKNNLRGLIQSIARTAEHVASASEELSSSASLQAQSAETQKGQATQVAVAMHEMSGTVGEVSENSTRAAQAARQAAETAREGGNIVEESLAKMRAIAEAVSSSAQKVEQLGQASDQIGRIIGVIDDIADQTNLLALNAAIEAARAGEQGRGFAVVADEVRKLAERTTSATKEVAQMVQSIQAGTKTAVAAMRDGTLQVQQGVETTSRAGDSLKQIIQMSEEVGEMITHIATAATEQSSASDQVNQNVEQIKRLVSESAVGAQESAKACQELSGLALDLQKMVSNFRLESRYGVANTASRPPSSPPQKSQPAGDTKTFAATVG